MIRRLGDVLEIAEIVRELHQIDALARDRVDAVQRRAASEQMERVDQHAEIGTVGASNGVPHERIFIDPLRPRRRTERYPHLAPRGDRGKRTQIGNDLVHVAGCVGRRR